MTLPLRGHCASVGFCGATFEGCSPPLWGDGDLGLGFNLFCVHGRELKRAARTFRSTRPSLESTQELAPTKSHAPARKDGMCGFARRPNTRGRLSGWFIENQNALYFPACRICCGQPAHLLDNENFLRRATPLSVRRREASQIRLTISNGPNEV